MNKILEIPASVFKLKEIDICQCGNEDNGSKDVLTWIDYFFKNENDRKSITKALAVEAKVPSHYLLRWNDTTPKDKVAKIFNRTISKLKKGCHADN